MNLRRCDGLALYDCVTSTGVLLTARNISTYWHSFFPNLTTFGTWKWNLLSVDHTDAFDDERRANQRVYMKWDATRPSVLQSIKGNTKLTHANHLLHYVGALQHEAWEGSSILLSGSKRWESRWGLSREQSWVHGRECAAGSASRV